MIKKQVNRFRDWIEDGLRRVCGGMSPERRLITILAFCVIFGSLSIYMTVSSIYNIGKRDAEQKYLEIEHMKRLELQYSNDSINHLKQQKYEREQSNGQ
ncbi:hypothetical protein SDC9_35574 [bioreactor metagenome]|uniref:DUF3989 domain-containing protein n=1 Tax=bioreactor metagenome TaxID=1076179 RepID=A0A644VDX8_9ZZZZ|nr:MULTISPECIES: TraL conjugative transposon family protein [Bacteroidales]MCP3894466.1 DUF3989 domain-containing protein [Bacteroides sp.]MCP4219085.1 DUF3989 domain-containing protein [bacterium]